MAWHERLWTVSTLKWASDVRLHYKEAESPCPLRGVSMLFARFRDFNELFLNWIWWWYMARRQAGTLNGTREGAANFHSFLKSWHPPPPELFFSDVWWDKNQTKYHSSLGSFLPLDLETGAWDKLELTCIRKEELFGYGSHKYNFEAFLICVALFVSRKLPYKQLWKYHWDYTHKVVNDHALLLVSISAPWLVLDRKTSFKCPKLAWHFRMTSLSRKWNRGNQFLSSNDDDEQTILKMAHYFSSLTFFT